MDTRAYVFGTVIRKNGDFPHIVHEITAGYAAGVVQQTVDQSVSGQGSRKKAQAIPEIVGVEFPTKSCNSESLISK